MRRFPFLFWFFVALIIRFLASFTHSSWFHPDEWFQSIELSNIITKGFGYYSQEVGLHLRNMSWPVLLSIPLRLTDWWGVESVNIRVFAFHFFAGLCNLGILWGFWQLIQDYAKEKFLPGRWKFWGLALVVLPWFTVYNSVNPAIENASAAALMISIGLTCRNRWKSAGFFAIAAAAFRYPTGLGSVGILTAIFFNSARNRNYKPTGQFIKGMAIGLVLFGIPDWVIYGRPWESLWMYLQYNIFTGLSAEVFGKQSVYTYAEFFLWRWYRYFILAPFGIVLVISFIRGFFHGIKNVQPWSIALLFYSIGHMLIGHKEARFVLPAEPLLLWGAFLGLILWNEKLIPSIISRIQIKPSGQKIIRVFVVLFLTANVLLLLKAVWGETWVASGTYREISKHLIESKDVCAVITVKHPMGALLPWKKLDETPRPALGYFTAERDKSSFVQANSAPVLWLEHQPACAPNENILIHINVPDTGWNSIGCETLASGFLSVLPKGLWNWAFQKNYARGTWYRCPAGALTEFKSQHLTSYLAKTMGHIVSLPPIGITGDELIALGKATSPPPASAVLPR